VRNPLEARVDASSVKRDSEKEQGIQKKKVI